MRGKSVLAAALALVAIVSFVALRGGGDAAAQAVERYVKQHSGVTRADCVVRGAISYRGRSGVNVYDCWMSRDAKVSFDDSYSCFVNLAGRIDDVTPLVHSDRRYSCTAAPPASAVVDRVLTGDTIALADGTVLRLANVDAPETRGNECYAAPALDVLRRLVPEEGTVVGLRKVPNRPGWPAGGPPSAYVFNGQTNVNLALVARGAASVELRGVRDAAAAQLVAAARHAKRGGRGLWGLCPGTRLDSRRPLTAHRLRGMWMPVRTLARLPAAGLAWEKLSRRAEKDLGPADITNLNSKHDTSTLAAALLYGRTHAAIYRSKVAAAIASAMAHERRVKKGALARSRNVVSYVVAADLINLRRYAPRVDARFRAWLRRMPLRRFQDGTIAELQDLRPNANGTIAGAARVAIAIYLGDAREISRSAQILKGWLGDRRAYAGFRFHPDVTWQADPANPVGINPARAVKAGHSIDGAMPEEMRHGCELRFPPCVTKTPWGTLQGAFVQAQLLHRQGYDTFSWSDQALRRAVGFLYRLSRHNPAWWSATRHDDGWVPVAANYWYRTHFPTLAPTKPGKNIAWVSWTHRR